jgi:hypothetical protein
VNPPLIFLDIESTGVEDDADIWEFAAIRRQDGEQTDLHLFVRHDPFKCAKLPDLPGKPFQTDHRARFPGARDGCIANGGWSPGTVTPERAAFEVWRFTAPVFDSRQVPHLVGCMPHVDVGWLKRIMRPAGYEPAWSYHLTDVENLARGWLRARDPRNPAIGPPWRSDDVFRAVGVDPDQFDRHTAMGDVLLAVAVYDQLMGTVML